MPRSNQSEKPLLSKAEVAAFRRESMDDPAAALQKLSSRIRVEKQLRVHGKIDAIQSTSKRRQPMTAVQSLDAEFKSCGDRDSMIATARNLEQNFSPIRGMTQIDVNMVVGLGPNFQSRAVVASDARPADEYNRRREAWIKERMKPRNFDARGVLNFASALRLVERRLRIDGDIGAVMVKGGRLQFIEADRIADPPRANQNDKATYVHGVEVDRIMAPKTWHIYNRGGSMRYRKNREYVGGVKSERFIHVYDPERFDQVRGMSALIAAINDSQDLRETLEAIKGSMKIEQLLGIFFTSDLPKSENVNPFGSETNYDVTNAEGGTETRKETLITPSLGSMSLLPGEDVKAIQKQTPGAYFDDFTMLVSRWSALAYDMPLEVALQLYTKGTFAALRGALAQYNGNVDIRRRVLLEPFFCDRWVAWITNYGHKLWIGTDGERGLEPPGDGVIVAHEWIWPNNPVMERLKEAQADREGYRIGKLNRSDYTHGDWGR